MRCCGSLRTLSLALAATLAILDAPTRADDPPRPTRAQSDFGLHFDLHANLGIQNAGETLTEPMVEELLQAAKPDFIQIDCKGHPGVSSYPTEVPDATHVPGFVRDPLELIRRVTARHGVALYLHYSGVWDSQALAKHPDWAVVQADGKPSTNHVSFFGPYVDRILIPQLRELRTKYGVDGVWIDGDCWAVEPDYRPEAVAAFKKATGLPDIPHAQDDPNYRALLDFTRASFRRYVGHYVEELHRTAPGLQVASNWAFSSRMPEPVDLPLDFFSGDFSPTDSVRVGAYEARCLEPQARSVGKPWDLMDWSFAKDWSHPDRKADPKTALQLSQSAAQVLALGGAYQAYFRQNADLSFRPVDFPVMAELSKFVRARAPITRGSHPVPQVALLYSTEGWRRDERAVYQTGGTGSWSLRGVLQLLLEAPLSTEIVMTHHLRGHVAEYPLVVVPDWSALEPDLRSELLAHVRQGGRMLVVGPRITRDLAADLGLALVDQKPGKATLRVGETSTEIDAASVALAPTPGSEMLAALSRGPDAPASPAALIVPVGQGRVGVILPEIGRTYLGDHAKASRDLVATIAARLVPEPRLTVTGSPDVNVVLAARNGTLLVNLLNVAGPHADNNQPVFSSIPPIGPLTVTLRTPEPPRRVTLEPGGLVPTHRYADGLLTVEVPTVEVHSILVVQ